MCIFSAPVKAVQNTRIFAKVEDGVQTLIYQMAYDADMSLAMVLPVPVEERCEVEFISFEHQDHKGFFDELDKLFAPRSRMLGAYKSADPEPRTLKVHQVGSFEASHVPTIHDLANLDERFVVNPEVWAALGQKYGSGGGFVVVKLRPGALSIHPLGMKFPTMFPDEVYFPTVHVHDGKIHEQAHFDHLLYLQTSAGDKAAAKARFHAQRKLELSPFLGLFLLQNKMVLNSPVRLRAINGFYPNDDTWAPAC